MTEFKNIVSETDVLTTLYKITVQTVNWYVCTDNLSAAISRVEALAGDKVTQVKLIDKDALLLIDTVFLQRGEK